MSPSGEQHDVATIYAHYKAMYNASNVGASTSASAAPPAPQNAPSNVARRPHRLPEDALEILREFYRTKTTRPSAGAKRELLARIHQIPGTEWYSINSINSWFNGRRMADLRKEEKKDGTASILWPSLDKAKIDKLQVLHRQRPPNIPLSKLVQTWARALGSDVEHVQAWIDYNDPSEEASELVDRKPALHLPTPEATASPEPGCMRNTQSPTVSTPQAPPVLQPFSTMPPAVKRQPFSPVQPFFVPSQTQSPVSQSPVPQQVPQGRVATPQAPQASASPAPPPPCTPLGHAITQPRPDLKIVTTEVAPTAPVLAPASQPVAPAQVMQQEIASALQSSTASLLPWEMTFTSYTDADIVFEPMEKMCRDIIRKARGGFYASLGLDPASVSASFEASSDATDVDDGEDMDTSA
ncbi:hypothetical protein PsYK624_001760 [Phanerochaete sordida]|uniref:Homeobox domain-containing protein n=1 Tax=Phanerochaete sordida TaxID=48140 RepID=A0A9P3L6J5_9APHY|nr:hypothetical protein PsYK624_001760 [Phanerochaete sordida]